jgi:hypothetical protein
MLGVYNPSITQRLNGLTEKTESKVEITDAPDWLKGEIPTNSDKPLKDGGSTYISL